MIAELRDTPLALVDDVVERAQRAQRTWARLPQRSRIDGLRRIAELVRANSEELARIETSNVGKPIGASRAEVFMVADTFDYYAGAIDKFFGQTIPVDGGMDFTVHEPIGVVAVIAPWNFPLAIASWNVAAAIACGNSVIVKPAEITPLSIRKFEELIANADLPDGLFQVVLGKGSIVGTALTEHPGIGKISFTGSTETGQTIMRSAAGTMKRVTLELGGKSAAVFSRTPTWKGWRSRAQAQCSATRVKTAVPAVEFLSNAGHTTSSSNCSRRLQDPWWWEIRSMRPQRWAPWSGEPP